VPLFQGIEQRLAIRLHHARRRPLARNPEAASQVTRIDACSLDWGARPEISAAPTRDGEPIAGLAPTVPAAKFGS
jgi:hypothetical protein